MAMINATPETIDELIGTGYTVVDFYGDHCGPCKMMAPIFHAASNDLPLIQFVKANTEQHQEFSKRFGIHGIPTLHFYRDGQLIHEAVGAVDRDTLDGYLSKLLYD